MPCSSVAIVNFEHVIAGLVFTKQNCKINFCYSVLWEKLAKINFLKILGQKIE